VQLEARIAHGSPSQDIQNIPKPPYTPPEQKVSSFDVKKGTEGNGKLVTSQPDAMPNWLKLSEASCFEHPSISDQCIENRLGDIPKLGA
jgi:hypothetical protein